MDKLLYSKFSTERSREYAVITSIFKDEDGIKYIQKRPVYEEGIKHVQKCLDSYEKLKEIYKDTNLNINKARKHDEAVDFQFVTGHPYEEYVDKCLMRNGKEAAITAISDYFKKFVDVVDTISFEKSKEFEMIFGDYPEDRDVKSFDFTDVDMVMSNIICGVENVLIDYEWTFDFPIPVDYLKYRIIHYYVATNDSRITLNNPETYVSLGLDADMIPCYEEMERSFQKFIQKDCVKLGELLPKITPGSINLKSQILVNSDFEKSTVATVYIDNGNGFCEETKKKYTMLNGWFEREIDLEPDVRAVRIDPTECCGLCKLYKFDIDDKEVIKFTTNGHRMEDMIFFKNPDPNIVITLKRRRKHLLKIKLRFMIVDSSYYM